jgi:hypothetical protein
VHAWCHAGVWCFHNNWQLATFLQSFTSKRVDFDNFNSVVWLRPNPFHLLFRHHAETGVFPFLIVFFLWSLIYPFFSGFWFATFELSLHILFYLRNHLCQNIIEVQSDDTNNIVHIEFSYLIFKFDVWTPICKVQQEIYRK